MLDFCACPSRLIGCEVDKLRPASIAYRLRQMMVLHHALDIQIFKGDHAVLIDELPTQLVVKILTSVADFLMDGRHDELGFGSAMTTLDFAADPPLADFNQPFGFTIVVGRRNLFASLASRAYLTMAGTWRAWRDRRWQKRAGKGSSWSKAKSKSSLGIEQ